MNKYQVVLITAVAVIITFVLTAVLFPHDVIRVVDYVVNTQDKESIRSQSALINRLATPPPTPAGMVPKDAVGLVDIDSLKGYTISVIGIGDSMLPTLDKNSQVLLSKEPVTVGDIIVFDNGDVSWIHRIIGDNGDCWLVQGDGNRYTNQTEYVPKNTDIWRVMAIVY